MSAMGAWHLDVMEHEVPLPTPKPKAVPAYVTVDDEELVVCLTCGTLHPLESWCPRCDGSEDDMTVRESRIARDPHHGGDASWQWRDGKLYHRSVGASKWVECKRVSVTPARIRLLADLLESR